MGIKLSDGDPGRFGFIVSNVPGWLDPGVVIAATRAGALGVLNCENAGGIGGVTDALTRIARLSRGPFGVKLDPRLPLSEEIIASLPPSAEFLIFTAAKKQCLDGLVALARSGSRRVLYEVTCAAEAETGVAIGASALIAKGHEAGGAVGEETTFVLLQRLLADFPLPVWAYGGIGPHSAAACYVAGAAGVVLDNQVLLARESALPPKARAAVERMEGDETICLGQELDWRYRLYKRPGMAAVEQLQQLEQTLSLSASPEEARGSWQEAIASRVGWRHPETDVWPLGQDAAFAAPLARRFGTVSGIVAGLKDSIRRHVELARAQKALDRQAPLARLHGTDFPILQGPMTRVSDTAFFAAAVERGGALPFLALALLRAPQVRQLLAETKELLRDRPWGVGILGFVPAELRAEQLEVVREFKPPFAIIAGGRPDQAAGLERDGITCYLHVPAPGLLQMFLEDGARGFIFEGRECGGHVGPRTSFVLWETMIDVLLESIDKGIPAGELRVVFAGGIHDARSAAMVAAMAAPLVEKGAHIGVLLGTAYLFTAEAVETGAIIEGFQQEALQCSRTVLLESGPGHATRCVETPFYLTFLEHKRRMMSEKKSVQDIRAALEELNLGRLRIASKGVVRGQDPSEARHRKVSADRQKAEGMYMIGQVAALRRGTCTMRGLHEQVSPASVAFLSHVSLPEASRAYAEPVPAPCDVAIVGMGCVLPKAPNPTAFWENLLNKVDAISDEIPLERFNSNLYYDADRKAQDRMYSHSGGFLDDVPFDPMRFGIPPNALGSIDSMQLLSLVVVEQALRDAGYDQREFPRERTSVIFGLSGGLGDLGTSYAVRASLPQLLGEVPPELEDRLPKWTEDSFAGLLLNVAAGRVANRFNLGGVNFTVDAACASSLAAVYLAARELSLGSSDMVITGGVDTGQTPFGYLCFSSAQALSPRGRCRTFDQSADGIAISEGITVLVLKRLADAERDGDRIYAVIKSVAGSSDGRGRSMTAPRLEGQTVALRRAYAQAGIEASTIGLIEAHGTGTVAGDAAEMAALSEVFHAAGATPRSCAIGSVKSMLGHTKSAAGATSLMKVALALHHKVLPPTLHVEKPNPKLSEPHTPFFVNTEPQSWMEGEAPRRAGVSSFGFGGTNFHAVVEEYDGGFGDSADRPARDEWTAELFLWHAASAPALASSVQELAASLYAPVSFNLRDVAADVCQRSAAPSETGVRLAIVAASLDDLRAKLTAAGSALRDGKERLEDPAGIYLGPAALVPKVAFLFPGQGSQKAGMMSGLAMTFPRFRESLEQADRVLAGRLPKKLSAYIYPPHSFTPEDEQQRTRELTDTIVAQPALGAVEIALLRELERFGVLPDMTAGHSYGEYVALCAAGVLPEEDLFRLSEERGRAIQQSVEGDAGTMAAVQADGPSVERALGGTTGVWIANHNSPRQTVIAGLKPAIAAAITRLEADSLVARQIPVACAFHTPLMQPARDRLAAALARQSFAAPSVAVFSNTLGDRYPSDPERIRELLADHLVAPLHFTGEIQAMYDQGARVFVEVGPKGVLTGLARQILEGRDARFVQTDSSERDSLPQLLHAFAQLAVAGIPLETAELFRGRTVKPWNQAAPEMPESKWLVNGVRAFPRSEPLVARDPVNLRQSIDAARPAAPRTLTPANPLQAVAADGADPVMMQFQQLMTQFLQTQAAVMTAYLQGDAAQAGTSLSLPVTIPANAPLPLMPMPPAATPARPPKVVPIAQATPPAPAAARDYSRELVRIASERTGYPVDMLNLDAGIEADLGIDSIKRVEILTAFQRLCTPSEQTLVQGIMEKLTAARTLREITGQLTNALASAKPAANGLVTAPAAPAPARDVSASLVRIVSERTGYPAEMLNLDAGIEADLGIDSIKRVEILTAFQRLCTPSEQTLVQGIMENLTAARNLREIAGRITAVLQHEPPAAATANPAATPPARDVATELLRLVSERTGYPTDMLNPDAGIEADLGIDSIKRVEILTAFQRGCAAIEQARVSGIMEKLTASRTLREISDRIAAELRAEPAPARAAQTSVVPRFTLATAETPRLHGNPRYYPGRVCLITDDETGIASALAAEWTRAGERPLLLRHRPETTSAANGVFSTDLTDLTAVQSVVEVIRREHGPIGAVIHLLPLRSSPSAGSLAEWRNLIRESVGSLYALARVTQADLTQTGRAGGGLLAAITSRGGDFSLRPNPDIQPAHQAVADFTKTLALEFEGVRTKVVDLDPSDPAPILTQKLIDELSSHDDLLQVGLPGDRRLTVSPRHAPITQAARRQIGSDWVILLTGGARGITGEIARKLAERHRPTLILAGTSALPGEELPDTAGVVEAPLLKSALIARLRGNGANVSPAEVERAYRRVLQDREIRETLAAVRRAGAQVEYHAVDARDETSFGEFIDQIYQKHGRLDVAVHGAGIIEDKLLRDKTPESFARVVHTKADSAFLLSRKLRPESLQCLLFMSSITAALGNRGQADYAAANGIMNGLAIQLSARWPGRVVAMNWGPWDQAGMVSDDVRQQFVTRAIQLIPPDAGAGAALREIEAGSNDEPLVILGDGPWSKSAIAAGEANDSLTPTLASTP